MPHRFLPHLNLESICYGCSWVLLSLSSFDLMEKLVYGLITGIGIASGKWVVEWFQRLLRANGGCWKCTLKSIFKLK